MGAQWVHGEKDNAVYKLAAAAGEIRTDIHTLQSTGNGENVDIIYPRQGKKISREQWIEFHQVIENIYDSLGKDLADSPISLGEYFYQKYRIKSPQC